MSTKTVWFTRGDGERFNVEVGSAAYERMVEMGFQSDEPLEVKADGDGAIVLADLTKKQLIDYAEEKGIEINPKLNKADIIAAIEAADAETDETTD